MMPTSAFVAVLFVLGFVQAVPRGYPFSTTTTTTKRTTTEGLIIEGPIMSGCRCCGMGRCVEDISARYTPILMTSDFVRMAQNVDALCQTDVPRAERCLSNPIFSDCQNPATIIFDMFSWFCNDDRPSVLKGGVGCWTTEFQEGMKDCVQRFNSQAGSPDTACQAVREYKTCARDMMEPIPQCTSDHESFVVEFIRHNTLPLCPNQR